MIVHGSEGATALVGLAGFRVEQCVGSPRSPRPVPRAAARDSRRDDHARPDRFGRRDPRVRRRLPRPWRRVLDRSPHRSTRQKRLVVGPRRRLGTSSGGRRHSPRRHLADRTHRPTRNRHRAARTPVPSPSAYREPDPRPERHRPSQPALRRRRLQRRVAPTRVDRARSHRVDAETLFRWCARDRRTETTPSPRLPRRGHDRPHRGQTIMRFQRTWPWVDDIVTAFTRMRVALPG